MKKVIIVLFLCFALAAGLAGCGNKSGKTEGDAEKKASSKEEIVNLAAASAGSDSSGTNASENSSSKSGSSVETKTGPDPKNILDLHIVSNNYRIPDFQDDPGFTQIYADEIIAPVDVTVYTGRNRKASAAGILHAGDRFSIISKETGDWFYIESGKVRGFICEPESTFSPYTSGNTGYSIIASWEIAVPAGYTDPSAGTSGMNADGTNGSADLSNGTSGSDAGASDGLQEPSYAEQLMEVYENPALLYRKETVRQVRANPVSVVSLRKKLPILEERKEGARTIGTLTENGTGFLLEDCGDGWFYIESGYVRGFVPAEDVLTGEEAQIRMAETGVTKQPALAQVLFVDNKAAYYTFSSVDPGRTVWHQRREYTQVESFNRANELQIPETFNGYEVGWVYTCTPYYASRDWMFDALEVWKLWWSYGSGYSENVAVIDTMYLIACAQTYGKIGDFVTFYLDDGTALNCILADVKSTEDPHYTTYGHIIEDQIDVIEAETNENINPGVEGCVPWWGGHRVVSCVNHGTFQPY
ncbi:MAG: hypothetical protein HUJ73_06300 [Eubacterium sp.]|nr:hypothetical protein [Eubacterium sp.]